MKRLGIIALILFSAFVLSTCAGPVGKDGKPGEKGPAGRSCSQTPVDPTAIAGDVAQYGGSIITCSDKSVFIHNGAPGIEGSEGPTGAQGATGQAGSVITAVQFCPNYQVSYPNTFPEIGFCFNGDLYAAYWDRPNLNAWLTIIPPGYYASTSTSAPCNFTVLVGCVVQ